MAGETGRERCHAITEDGERCQRPAGEDGFCYQHDESDETVDEYDDEAGDGDQDVAAASDEQGREAVSDGGAAAETEGEPESDQDADDDAESGADETDSGDEEADGGADEQDSEDDEADSGSDQGGRGDGLSGVREVRAAVQSLAPEVIGRELDGVIEIDGRDDGWLAVVEIVERPAVPDSQDILGRYEIDLAGGEVTGYRRLDRYRRSDTQAVEPR